MSLPHPLYTTDGYQQGAMHLHMIDGDSRLELALRQVSGEGELISEVSFDTKTWHHLVTTFDADSGDVAQYVDGALQSSANLGADGSGVDLITGRIGGWSEEARGINGQLDEVAIYGRALSAEEVLAHYTMASEEGKRARAPGAEAPNPLGSLPEGRQEACLHPKGRGRGASRRLHLSGSWSK